MCYGDISLRGPGDFARHVYRLQSSVRAIDRHKNFLHSLAHLSVRAPALHRKKGLAINRYRQRSVFPSAG